MFRLYLDIPLGHDEEAAVNISLEIAEAVKKSLIEIASKNKISLGVRLGNDQDRQKSNYLRKNENGHVGTKRDIFELSGENNDGQGTN